VKTNVYAKDGLLLRIGYACLTVGVPDTAIKSCLVKNASGTRLRNLISHNLNSLENIISYNGKNNIGLFRISSGLIPFASHPINQIPWWEIYKNEFLQIGQKIKANNIRVSMHPGQYTVLNSPFDEVVARALADLEYHSLVLDSLGVGADHKIILHIGGVYNNKKTAMKRFIINFKRVSDSVKRRIVIENDDKSYNIKDVLEIASDLKIPVVFDKLHNDINPADKRKSAIDWIKVCRKTWRQKDGIQKIHYSQQHPDKKTGSHSESINLDEFYEFYGSLKRKDIDIMFEVKDKNISALNCLDYIKQKKSRD